MILEYDGTNYYGFQLQANKPTIQAQLEAALQQLTVEKIRVRAASRTDTGVHARGQVVSFRTHSALPVTTLVNGLNHYLPEDIAVLSAHRVEDTFDVRRAAVSREYSYYVLNRATRSPVKRLFAYQVSRPLDIAAMDQACQYLVGTHDFASFASRVKGVKIRTTIRHVYRATVSKDGEMVVFNMVANAFLPHQVRNTVGSLIRVGLGRISLAEFGALMAARKIGAAGPAVPARALCLERVNYSHDFGEN
ncbi:MAG: tRNA pseudouridine(38-40) synthase TruA [Chloroflexi bacterium]|nr:tRNA pseudouridine(38-40) synthase TruA [Chloroflexota bacterium]